MCRPYSNHIWKHPCGKHKSSQLILKFTGWEIVFWLLIFFWHPLWMWFFLFSLREAVSIVCAHPKRFVLCHAHLVFIKVHLLQHLKSNGYMLSKQQLTITLVAGFGTELLFIKESIIFSCGLGLRSVESYSVLMVSHPLNYGVSVLLIN